MARGREAHQAHLAAVASLGRALSRRAGNRCELCTERTSLRVVELPPEPEEPEEDLALLVCERCAPVVAGGDPSGPDHDWRALAETAWSEVVPVQIAAVRALRKLALNGVSWAQDTAESLYLDEEIEARI